MQQHVYYMIIFSGVTILIS